MASISEQTTDPKRARYKVRWREADGSARSESFDDLRAAKRRKREVETTIESGTYVDERAGRMTLREWSEIAVPGWVDLGQSTRERYASDIATHILPLLGDRPLRDLSTGDVRKLVTKLTRTHAAATVRKCYYVLCRLCDDAVREKKLAVSPCGDVRLPPVRNAVPETLTRTEIDKLANELPDEYRAFAYVAGRAGLRISEALALRWSDVDLDGKVPMLTVRGTKSDAAIRSVPLQDVVIRELRSLREWTDPAPRSLVFPAARGGRYAPGNFRNRVFYPAMEAIGLAGITPHALRHSSITAWLEAGATPMLAAAWAGHADKGALILRRYGHVRPTHAAQVLDAMNEEG